MIPKGAEYHESLASSWSDKYKKGGFSKRIRVFQDLLAATVEPHHLWLDAGCGSGILSSEIACFGAKVIAVDASPKMIEAARSIFDGQNSSVSFETISSVESLNFKDGFFDGCVCSSVLEYVDDPDAALTELSRVIKKDGHLIISVANRKSIVRIAQKAVRSFFRIFGFRKFSYLEFSLNTFDGYRFTGNLEENGFKVISVKNFDPVFTAIKILEPFASLIVVHAVYVDDRSRD